MVQDLKEIIEHVNQANPSASAADGSDPVVHIAKILNAHMDSLQWVDQNSSKCLGWRIVHFREPALLRGFHMEHEVF